MKYIAQTLPYEMFHESEKINTLFKNGLEVLHIRKPLYSKKEMSQLISQINADFHSKIVIHSHFSLLKTFCLKGIHVGLKDVHNSFKSLYYNYLKTKFNISISVTTSKVVKDKLDNPLIDYAFIGPLFVKFSEESQIQKFDSFEMKKELSIIDKEIYALGCMSLKNITAADFLGFQGSVLQSYLWKSDDIDNAFNTLKLNTNIKHVFQKEMAM